MAFSDGGILPLHPNIQSPHGLVPLSASAGSVIILTGNSFDIQLLFGHSSDFSVVPVLLMAEYFRLQTQKPLSSWSRELAVRYFLYVLRLLRRRNYGRESLAELHRMRVSSCLSNCGCVVGKIHPLFLDGLGFR